MIRALACAFLLIAMSAHADERVTMSLRDVDIQEAMAMLAKQERLNILLSKQVEGTLSLNLYDVDTSEAVKAIANAAGYAVEVRSGAYFVIPHEEVGMYNNGDLTRVQRFNVHYADPTELEEMLEPYLSRYGTVKAIAERKLLLVSDKPEFLRRIALVVKHADAKPKQVVIEARILEVTLNEEDSFGINWAKLFDSQEGSGVFGAQGFAGAGSSGSNGFFFDYVNPNLDMVLTMLEQDGRVRTLSTPKLVALDNQEAEVIIGDRRGYTVTTTINQVTSQSIEFLESGVILRVTPHVDSQGDILLDVHPEVSTGTVDTAGVPSQTTTEVTTSLLVPSGETVFIGGLIKHTVSQGYKRVPVLGRVPVVKRLFSARERTQSNTETIVLITPRVVGDLTDEWNTAPIEIVEESEESLRADADTLKETMDEEATSPDWLADFKWPNEQPDASPTAEAIVETVPVRDEHEPVTEDVADDEEPPEVAAQPIVESPDLGYLLQEPAEGLHVVQVMTMSNRARMEAYLDEIDAPELPIVQIEAGGQAVWALVTRAHPTFADAKRAIEVLPAVLREASPWVRTLASLKASMERAERMRAVAMQP